ncbi:MAG: selenium-dependent molybdenum cofactor biosynthesis protein YqeB [Chloroflexi bacterium]|nr:selenium-dependent molybdenum cofactor biosynthesis protein YqeB [Chloroflexota bacterium]
MPSLALADIIVLIKGAGDLATGVATRLWRSGFRVAMTELPQPTAIRRTAVFAEAVYDGRAVVEGLKARRATSLAEIEAAWRDDAIPVMIAPGVKLIRTLRPAVIVDAIMAKRNLGTAIGDAGLVIGLGPGFVAGQDVHAVIETSRGHYLGRVLWQGAALPDTGVPGEIGGQARKRVICAPAEGIFEHRRDIGTLVQEGEVVGLVAGTPVLAPTSGVLRGLIHDGVRVPKGLKIGDVDPRGAVEHCFTVSDKALAIGGGVLEAILTYLTGRCSILPISQEPMAESRGRAPL